MEALRALIGTTPGAALVSAIRDFAAPFAEQVGGSELQASVN
jgi:hypothetical protein